MPKDRQAKAERKVVAAFTTLTDTNKRRVLALLKKALPPDPASHHLVIEKLRDQRFPEGFACPRCTSKNVVRNGKARGIQRYFCRDCDRTFSDHTCSPLRGTHYPKLWLPLMECLINGLSIRRTAKLLGVADSTVFTWRHKVLEALKRLDLGDFVGITEVDETYFLYSEKGKKGITGRQARKRGGCASKRGISNEQVCVVVARDRNKHTHSRVACCGAISRLKAQVVLGKHFGAVTALCADANSTWRRFAQDVAVDHKELNLSKKCRSIQQIYHIQNVNAFHSRLKEWMRRFRGVATKFLDNYLALFLFIDAHALEAMTAKRLELIIRACLPISPERYHEIRNTRFVLPA